MTIGGLALLAALLCAATMGLALQRGGTCTVAAVDELLKTGRPTRLLAMAEAAFWVGAGLLLARSLGLLAELPGGYALSGWTLAGAALLGLGAVLNRACIFGAVARFGSGEWAYLATPFGFYLGCVSAGPLFAPPAPVRLAQVSPLNGVPGWLAGLLLALALGRLLLGLARWRRTTHAPGRGLRPWSPHAATTVIGLAFAAMLLLAGAWSYTDVLAELAHAMRFDMSHNIGARVLIALALLAGALAGGWKTRQRQPLAAAALARCLGGGLLMGWGSLLTPGGNDGLVLIGLPLLWPYAWAAFAAMVAAIAAALWRPRH